MHYLALKSLLDRYNKAGALKALVSEEVVHTLAYNIALGNPEGFGEGAVDLHRPALAVDYLQTEGRVLDHRIEEIFRLLNLPPQADPVGDVRPAANCRVIGS